MERAKGKVPSSEEEAQLGIEAFRAEDYVAAAAHFESAVLAQPDSADWEEMLALARLNAEAEVHVPVPPRVYFDRDALLAPSLITDGALPPSPKPLRLDSANQLRKNLGDAVGDLASVATDMVTSGLGTLAGYRDRVWTNWYRRHAFIGVLTLAYMRDQLNKYNLINTYPPGAKIGFQAAVPSPPAGVTHFRTANGAWNSLDDPMEGAAGSRFTRNVQLWAIRPETGERLLMPNPREISRKLLTRDGPMQEVPFLNMLAATWINFENHDWISHGESLSREIIEIPLSEDDPLARKHRQRTIFVGKTQPDPTRMDGRETAPVTFINEVTHWWDGSQIYGSDQQTQDELRSHIHGKLRLDPDGTLPLDGHGIEMTGFRRNWWIGLAMMHTLFAQEHNAICDRLRAVYPHWDDNRLFNVARLVNAAVMAKIHTVEWTPAILPNKAATDGLNANWYGFLTNLLRRGRGKKTVAFINVRNPEMGGIVGNPINKHGAPYGLAEEFVEVYRLHAMLPETLVLKAHDSGEVREEVPFPMTRQAGSAKLNKRVSMTDLFFSFGNQHPGQLVLNNYPRFLQELSIPGNPVFDMGAVDILRARERGVPRYNEFRRHLGLNPIRRLEDLTRNEEHLSRLREIYGTGPEAVEAIDLMIGTLAEDRRPTGFGFGETLFQIFILNATRRLQADRFYTDSYNEETYTPEGLEWIDRATLKGVLLRHYPDLVNTGLANVKNAFEPWDTDAILDPARHPLRAFDKELGPNRWRGEAQD